MPIVSVVMPVYNGEKYLAAAIESILAQTFTDFEFIIVDDCSLDSSAAIVRAYMKQDARIHFFQLEKNQGQAVARNRGIRAARGDYIAAMDSDDISLPERLGRQVEYLQAHPEIGAVGVGTQVVDDALSPLGSVSLHQSHALIALTLVAGGSALVRASLMLRRRFLVSGGGYRNASGNHIDADSELTLRLLGDMRIRYSNMMDVLYLYRQHESNVSLGYDPEDTWWIHRRALKQLWGEAPSATVERFRKAHQGIKLSFRDRRLARQDYRRLIEAMAEARWIDPDDISCVYSEVNRRLETTTPRLWQMLKHWWRYNIGRRQSAGMTN